MSCRATAGSATSSGTGEQWTLLVHPTEYAIEVELTDSGTGEIRPVAPQEAWKLALELDRAETRYLIALEDTVERMDQRPVR